jgi:arylsulfatase A
VFDWTVDDSLHGKSTGGTRLNAPGTSLELTLAGAEGERLLKRSTFDAGPQGIGIASGQSGDVEANEALLISFNRDVIVESASLLSSSEVCGGYYQVGNASPMSIYCLNADIDDKDQSGILSDLGVLKAGETLRLDSRGRFESEAPGQWRLQALAVRVLN